MGHTRTRLAAKSAPRKTAEVEVTRAANPEVWAIALKMANGDPKRLRPQGPDTILIVN